MSDTKGGAHAPVSMDAEGAPRPTAGCLCFAGGAYQAAKFYSGRGHLEIGGHVRTRKGVVLQGVETIGATLGSAHRERYRVSKSRCSTTKAVGTE